MLYWPIITRLEIQTVGHGGIFYLGASVPLHQKSIQEKRKKKKKNKTVMAAPAAGGEFVPPTRGGPRSARSFLSFSHWLRFSTKLI